FDRYALLHRDALLCRTSRSGLNRAIRESLQWHAAFHQFLLENIVDRLELEFVNRMQNDGVFTLKFDIGFRILKIEPGMNFFQRLLDGVRDLLQIDLAHNVKSILWHDLLLTLQIPPPR